MNSYPTLPLNQQRIDQLAAMFKAIGQPLRIQIITILLQERLVSIPTLQAYLPGVDQFLIYSNLRHMHKNHLVKKLQKGREVFYGLSEKAMVMGLDAFFQHQSGLRQFQIEQEAVLCIS